MHYTKINIMVPTYHRLAMFDEFITSAIGTCSNVDSLVFTVMTNIDDHTYDAYKWPDDCDVMREDTTRPNLAHYYNEMYKGTKWQGPSILVSMLGDDMVFETKGWDKKILDKANEISGIGIIHCEDVFMQHGAIPVNLFTSRLYVDAAGPWFMCPDFMADWIDTIWGEIATATDTNYFLDDVIIHHYHNMGKNTYDETYKRLQTVKVKDSKKMQRYIDESVYNLQRSLL